MMPGGGSDGARRQGDLAGQKIWGVHAAMDEFDGRERTVPVDRVGHQSQRGKVGIVPEPALDVRR